MTGLQLNRDLESAKACELKLAGTSRWYWYYLDMGNVWFEPESLMCGTREIMTHGFAAAGSGLVLIVQFSVIVFVDGFNHGYH